MVIITNLKEANKWLNEYSNATVDFYMYSISLRRVILKITSRNHLEVLMLVAVNSKYMKGNFSWDNANLQIRLTTDQFTGHDLTFIADQSSEFELLASGGFSLLKGELNKFGNSFENFIPTI